MSRFERETTTLWKNSDLDTFFIDNVQGGEPYTTDMHNMMLRLISANDSAGSGDSLSFMDLGCGNGFLSKSILARYPKAAGVLVDFSEHMLNMARSTFKGNKNLQFVQTDLSEKNWVEKVGRGSFDAVVSGFAIHNFRTSDASKREFYSQILGLLKPGGLFVNLELVGVSSYWIVSMARQLSEDSITEFQKRKGSSMTGKQVMEEFGRREGWKPSDPNNYVPRHPSAEEQCEWLRSAGFADVDCFFKVFSRAVIGGRRPRP